MKTKTKVRRAPAGAGKRAAKWANHISLPKCREFLAEQVALAEGFRLERNQAVMQLFDVTQEVTGLRAELEAQKVTISGLRGDCIQAALLLRQGVAHVEDHEAMLNVLSHALERASIDRQNTDIMDLYIAHRMHDLIEGRNSVRAILHAALAKKDQLGYVYLNPAQLTKLMQLIGGDAT